MLGYNLFMSYYTRKSSSSDTAFVELIIFLILIVSYFVFTPIFASMNKADRVIDTLQLEGHSNISIVSKDIWFWNKFRCGSGDRIQWITISEKNDTKVKSSVCQGFFKGMTVRTLTTRSEY